MKALLTLLVSLSALTPWWGSGAHLRAQDCKPSVARTDRITKDQVDIWAQKLWSTGFGASLMGTSETGIVLSVGRYGSLNAMNLQVEKREESATAAAFESAYRGAVGKPFFLGFASAEPLAFTVTTVQNAARIGNDLQDLFKTKGVTTVVLSAIISDNALARMRDQLTSRQVDGVRIRLAGEVVIEKSVSTGNGQKLLAKFSCFFQALDKRGIDLLATAHSEPASPEAIAAVGKYLRRYRETDFLQLDADGRFSLVQDGKAYNGQFAVKSDELILQVSGRSLGGSRLARDTIIDNEGIVWIRAAEPKQAPGAALTIDQVIQMSAAKVSDDIIIMTIQKAGVKFDITPEILIKLKNAGVSDTVIRIISRAGL